MTQPVLVAPAHFRPAPGRFGLYLVAVPAVQRLFVRFVQCHVEILPNIVFPSRMGREADLASKRAPAGSGVTFTGSGGQPSVPILFSFGGDDLVDPAGGHSGEVEISWLLIPCR